jgi:TRAP-type uncharacterized transport system substrate-binding protein
MNKAYMDYKEIRCPKGTYNTQRNTIDTIKTGNTNKQRVRNLPTPSTCAIV